MGVRESGTNLMSVALTVYGAACKTGAKDQNQLLMLALV